MTGKDFSGPTPEIRPPPVLTLAETGAASDSAADGAISTAKQQSQPSLLEDDGEVLGDITSYEYAE
jgi:transcription factor TFIIIB component B''